MNNYLTLITIFIIATIVSITFFANPTHSVGDPYIIKEGSLTKIWTNNTQNRPLIIRVLILRHANEQMAVGDANLVIRAVDRAKSAGLNIQIIGNHLVQSLSALEQAVEENINKNAVVGDTLIVHTIGHGSHAGTLQALGRRTGVFNVLAAEAAKDRQEMLWWQLSCYASAGLPKPEDEYFSNLASSNAKEQSYFGVQGKIMEKVFMALANKDAAIDPDGDGTVTASELRDFLNKVDSKRRGDLIYARGSNEPIFGIWGPWAIPIRDRMNPNQEYPSDYIPLPRGY